MGLLFCALAIFVFSALPLLYLYISNPFEFDLEKNTLFPLHAGIMLIVKDGLILAVSRRHNKEIFGLPGGKFDEVSGDKDTLDTAIRETQEETGIIVKSACFIYERVEMGDGPNKADFYSTTYYAMDWDGEPQNNEEGVEVKWLTAKELTSTKAAFGDYNRNMLDIFKTQFPDVKLIEE
jgi:8-oxo-dGTP pyrophosphatase MutT (NUDIX family)